MLVKPGKIVQIMPGYFSIDDPSAHKIIYGHGHPWVKGEFYSAWDVGPHPEQNNLFALRDPSLHATMRRKVAAMFSMSSLVSYEPYVDHCVDLFYDRLQKFAAEGKIINLGNWMQFFAFDAVSMITVGPTTMPKSSGAALLIGHHQFGDRLGFLNKGEDVEELIADSHTDHAMLTLVSVYPWLTPIVKKLAKLITGAQLVKFLQYVSGRIETTRRDLAEKDQDLEDGPVYMVKKLIDAQRRNDNKKGISDWDILANMAANIGAGSDTTAVALSMIIHFLYSNPDCLRRLREEIDSANLPERPRFQDVQKLAYLQAVIKEALRLSPGFGLPLWRVVPQGGAVVCGQFFPEGVSTCIFYCSRLLCLISRSFGEPRYQLEGRITQILTINVPKPRRTWVSTAGFRITAEMYLDLTQTNSVLSDGSKRLNKAKRASWNRAGFPLDSALELALERTFHSLR